MKPRTIKTTFSWPDSEYMYMGISAELMVNQSLSLESPDAPKPKHLQFDRYVHEDTNCLSESTLLHLITQCSVYSVSALQQVALCNPEVSTVTSLFTLQECSEVVRNHFLARLNSRASSTKILERNHQEFSQQVGMIKNGVRLSIASSAQLSTVEKTSQVYSASLTIKINPTNIVELPKLLIQSSKLAINQCLGDFL